LYVVFIVPLPQVFGISRLSICECLFKAKTYLNIK
jgi:hypothetical protein